MEAATLAYIIPMRQTPSQDTGYRDERKVQTVRFQHYHPPAGNRSGY